MVIKRLFQNQLFPPLVSIALIIFFSVVLINLTDFAELEEKAAQLIDTNGVLGMPLFLAGSAALYILLFPSTVLGAASGVIFGFWFGILVYSVSCLIASFITFLVVRFFFRNKAQKMILNRNRLAQIQSIADSEGIKFLFFLRFLPVHATIVNSLLALSLIKPSKFLLSCIFLVPEWILHVYIGYVTSVTTMNAIQQGLGPTDYFRIVSLIISIIAIVYLASLAQKALRKSGVNMNKDSSTELNMIKGIK
jgi:uncharacterized membrane protein YdjX (TVP38/TMEM64 family)